MLGKLKNGVTNSILGVRRLFTSPEGTTTYVKDIRKVLTYGDGRKCQYPKNYDQIVKFCKIIPQTDEYKNLKTDKEGNTLFKLLYGPKDENGERPSFNLALVKEACDVSYFTIDFNCPIKQLDESYLTSFGFTILGFTRRIHLQKYAPLFEVNTKSLELTNSPVLTKEIKENGKINEVLDKEGRNDQLLYISDYKELNISFFEIRDHNKNREWPKSLISVPIVLATSLAEIAASVLTYLPMKLGESLINVENKFVSSVGRILFIPAAVVKNLVNVWATFLRLPICAFVAKREKYGDRYFTMWKYQLKECWKEAKSDFEVAKDGKRESEQKEKYQNLLPTIGTWDELDAKRPELEEGCKKKKNTNSEIGTDTLQVKKSLSNEVVTKQQEATLGGEEIRALSTNHVDRCQHRKQDPKLPAL